MNPLKFYSVVGLLLLIGCVSIQETEAQKKKRNTDTQTQGLRQREAEFYFTEGEKYFILEDFAKALLYYQKSLEVSPDNATVHYKIAEVLSRSIKNDDLVKASISIENALKLEKGNKYFYILAASIYNGLARFDKAAQAYETMITTISGTEEYLFELAAVYQYDNQQEEAINAYTRAEQAFGVNELSSTQKIKLYLEAGKTAEAIAEGEKLLKAFPQEERYVMAFAETLAQNNQQATAIRYLEKFITETDEAGNVKMLLAGFYRDTQQEEKARKMLMDVFDDNNVELGSKIIVLGAYNTELNHNKSTGLDQDKADFVTGLYQKLAAAYPQEPEVHILGGDLNLTIGNDLQAIYEYNEALKLGNTNFEVWQNLLFLETKVNQFDNVIRHSDQALEYYPNQPILYYFNGYAHLRKRHYEEATASLEQAKKIISNNDNLLGEINSMLGDAYHATRQYDKSDKAYNDALALNPNNDVVLNNYSYYLALRKENLEAAEKMSSQLIKNNPDNPTYLDTYAWVLYMRQKYKDARKAIERAISTGKATATHFEHYGDILFKLGDVNGAVMQWEKAKGADANNELLDKKIANRKIYE